MAKVSLEFALEGLAKASKDVSSFSSSATKSLSSLESSFNSLKKIAAIALGGFTIGKAIEAAEEQEIATAKLNFALAQTGENVSVVSERFDKFAATLQKTTGVSDDAILNQLALTKTLGLSNDQAEQLLQTAIDLSAVTGDTLETSVDKLAKSFSGATGELGRLFPELKGFTDEQLRSGAAVEFLNSKLAGSAANLTNTFGGAIKLLKTNIGEFGESIGFLITQNPLIIAAVKNLSKLFELFGDTLNKNRAVIISFVNDGVLALAGALPSLIRGLGFLDLAFTRVVQGVKILAAGFAGLVAAIQTRSLSAFGEIADELEKDLVSSEDSLARRKGVIDDLATSTDRFVASLKKANTEQAKLPEKLPKKPIQFKTEQIQTVKTQEEAILPKQQITLLQNAASGLQQGAAGAAGVISNLSGFVVDKFLPGLGGIASTLIQLFAQGPEAVKAAIGGFLNQIPLLIENIIRAIPAFLDIVAERAPILVETLANKLVELLQDEAFLTSLVIAAQRFGLALQAQSGAIAVSFSIELIKQAPAIGLAMGRAAVNGIVEQFKSVGNIFGGGGGGGAVGGVVSGAKKLFGFADGGDVPGGAPFVDRVPALLTPGEPVLNRDTGARINAFLDKMESQGGGQTAMAPIVIQPAPVFIGEEEFARIQFNVKRAGYRTA